MIHFDTSKEVIMDTEPTLIQISIYDNPENDDLISIDGSANVPITGDILSEVFNLLTIGKQVNQERENERNSQTAQSKFYRQKEDKLKDLNKLVKGNK